MIDVVTVTGADESVRPEDLVAISREYSYVEFGILIGNHAGSPRFPKEIWKEQLDNLVVDRTRLLRLSAHLCGYLVTDFLSGDFWTAKHYSRHQVNTHGQHCSFSPYHLRRNVRRANLCGQQVIFQQDQVNGQVLRTCLGRPQADGHAHLAVSALHDLSHGEGRLPGEWPAPLPGVYTGYAGGLSPENVAEQVEKIMQVTGDLPFWIDAETHLRSDDGKRFDLDKVVRFLEAARPYVREPHHA